jgi:hypothetical protein
MNIDAAHDAASGRMDAAGLTAARVEPLTGIDGVCSRPVRRIVLRGAG